MMEASVLKEENDYLNNVFKVIDETITYLGSDLDVESATINDFKRYMFKENGSMDSIEIRSNMLSSQMEESAFQRKAKYLQKLYRIKNNPYFGRIDVLLEKRYPIYIGITYLNKNVDSLEEHLIYDWRSPIANLFYDGEIGKVSYQSPEGEVACELLRKRQYKIVNRVLKNVFDNSMNISDEVLQETLSQNSSDKMKNIVNTIQKEQNTIIRNITDKHLIVQGIAGSGKTSVALHRIAYLLYRLPSLSSSNVLIFSPNDIFSQYISNVLPELGEDNTRETTFSEFAKGYIKEYKSIEDFTSFISRHYTDKNSNKDLIKYKQSNEIIKVMETYIDKFVNSIFFTEDLKYLEINLNKDVLNELFKIRYNHLYIFERITKISELIANKYALSSMHKRKIESILYKIISFKKDYKKVYYNFYLSDVFKENYGLLSESEINAFVNKKVLNYEDSLLFIYMKGLIQGFPYSNLIKEIVVDEAQDYSILQYIILNKIFKRASWTILGDVNQTINPYYHYTSLAKLQTILSDANYLQLTKTYRSSAPIIEFANQVLGLDYVVSIRKNDETPVIFRKDTTSMQSLIDDITYLQNKYRKTCIITKDNDECHKVYESLKNSFDITNMLSYDEKAYNPNLIIIPSYLAKGLEFDSVIIYNDPNNQYTIEERYLYYVAITRAMHELIVYNN